MNQISQAPVDSILKGQVDGNDGNHKWGSLGLAIIMMGSEAPTYEEDINDLIHKFTQVLNLHGWDIRWKLIDDEKMGHSLMKIIPTRARNSAVIHISKSLVGKPTSEFGPLLLHEMLHLVVDKIAEEHETQLEYEVSESRFAEYNTRFISCLEKAIDQLTRSVSQLIALQEVTPKVLSNLTTSLQRVEEEKGTIKK